VLFFFLTQGLMLPGRHFYQLRHTSSHTVVGLFCGTGV
jgi:hypothetical protein